MLQGIRHKQYRQCADLFEAMLPVVSRYFISAKNAHFCSSIVLNYSVESI